MEAWEDASDVERVRGMMHELERMFTVARIELEAQRERTVG
jgi:hypothetical protein